MIFYNHFHKGKAIILRRSKSGCALQSQSCKITEPLYKVEELENLLCTLCFAAEKELTVYHTDSFDYVIPVVDDDSPLSFQVKVSKRFPKAVFRPAKTNVQAQISAES